MRAVQLAAGALGLLLGLLPGGPAAAAGCHQDPARRQLDFWLGEWRPAGEAGGLESRSVRKSDNGCLVEERWRTADGATGRSLSYFDPALGRWRQSRLDELGRVASFEGELRGGAMHFEGTRVEVDGSARRARLVLVPRPGPAVEERLELATKEADWELDFAGTYLPIDPTHPAAIEAGRRESPASAGAGAQQSPAAEPSRGAESASQPAAPAAATPAVGHGSVRPQTGMVTSEGLARGQSRVPMASPMVLRFPVGPVDRLEPGYAWRTKEVARYECEGTVIEEIRISRGRPKGGRQPLEVTASLSSNRRLARVRLQVLLYAGERPVASAVLESAAVGMGIPAQIQNGVVEHTLVLELDEGRLSEAFGGDESPQMEVTLEPLGRTG